MKVSIKTFGKAFLICVSGAACAQDVPTYMLAFEDSSCSAWVASATDIDLRAAYLFWIRGYVSGYNAHNPKRQLYGAQFPNLAALARYVDKYCHDHPFDPFVGAAPALIDDLNAVQ